VTHVDKRTVAAEVWQRMFGFLMYTRPQRDAVLTRLGLTPTESKALYSLDAGDGRTMRVLAAEWQCDPSTATWIVDRLERLGLVERRPDIDDRRRRLVVLTAKGSRVQAKLIAGMADTPPELLELTAGQLSALRDLLSRLPMEQSDSGH
jgi:DNA-binding MarR family transcriptional regulator